MTCASSDCIGYHPPYDPDDDATKVASRGYTNDGIARHERFHITPAPWCPACNAIKETAPMATTIDLTPTAEGFANIVKVLSNSILADVKLGRAAAVETQLESIIETVAYLTRIGRDDLIQDVRQNLR